MHILAIDDDLDFLKLLETFLRKKGHDVVIKENAQGVLDAIFEDRFNLVLVDWTMPEVDGITIIKALRTRDRDTGNRTKIIMVTAINNVMAESYAKRSGADGYLTKSENPKSFKEELFAKIDAVMAQPSLT